MASFHLSPKSFSRARGQSAIAASAYRSGQELCDDRTGQVHDYSRKAGVLQTEIMLPDAAPEWAQNLEKLWNEAEAAERRKDAKVAREFEISLPYELPYGQRLELAREFAQEVIDRYGVAAQVSLHAPGKEGDQRNWHAHILTTTRTLGEDGFGDKVRVLDSPKTSGEQIVELREKWADMQNRALAEAGLDVRVDHRTLAEQGIDREPQIHVGPHATGMERRGIETERGELNREIIAANQALAEINQTLAKVQEQQNERERIEHSFAEHGEALNGKLCEELEGYRRRLAEANTSHSREFSSAVGQFANAEFRDEEGLNSACKQIDISLQRHSENLGRIRELGEEIRQHRELESIDGDLKQASERLAGTSRGLEEIIHARAKAALRIKMEEARQAKIVQRLQTMQFQKPEAQAHPGPELKRQPPQKSPGLSQEGPKAQAPIPEVKKPGVAPQRSQNAPGANLELRVVEKAVEVQKAENRPSVAPVRPAQERAAPPRSPEGERVWFAYFDREWKTRGGSQRILSKEQNSPEYKARESLERPPECVLSADGRTWSGIFRDVSEAANYGRERREQALVEAQARGKTPQRPQEVMQAPIVANAVPARLKEAVASTKERLVDALQTLLAADAAYKKSFHAPREKVEQAKKQAQEHKAKVKEQAFTAAHDHAAFHGPAATLSLVREQLGRENFDLIREFERGLGRDRGLSR